MLVDKLASAIFNDVVSGLSGYEATISMSLELLQDEVVEERLYLIKTLSTQGLIPLKDLVTSLNCIELDCKSLDKCCNITDNFSQPVAHFEIPQIVNDYGELAILYIGSTDKTLQFKVYTNPTMLKYHNSKMRKRNKPYVYIDTTPNENNFYDGWVFNAPLLERLSITAIFKDPRQVQEVQCCGYEESDNMSYLAAQIKQSLILKKLVYYRLMWSQPTPNTQVPK